MISDGKARGLSYQARTGFGELFRSMKFSSFQIKELTQQTTNTKVNPRR